MDNPGSDGWSLGALGVWIFSGTKLW